MGSGCGEPFLGPKLVLTHPGSIGVPHILSWTVLGAICCSQPHDLFPAIDLPRRRTETLYQEIKKDLDLWGSLPAWRQYRP